MPDIAALDYMIDEGQYQYHCDPWYVSPGDKHYESVKGISGQINYRDEIFFVAHRGGKVGSGAMHDMGYPNSVNIFRIIPTKNWCPAPPPKLGVVEILREVSKELYDYACGNFGENPVLLFDCENKLMKLIRELEE